MSDNSPVVAIHASHTHFGSAFFWLPAVGPLLVAGPLVTWIVVAIEGAAVVGGASALGAGLYGMTVPEGSVLQYEAAVKADKYVRVAHGPTDGVLRAQYTSTTRPAPSRTSTWSTRSSALAPDRVTSPPGRRRRLAVAPSDGWPRAAQPLLRAGPPDLRSRISGTLEPWTYHADVDLICSDDRDMGRHHTRVAAW